MTKKIFILITLITTIFTLSGCGLFGNDDIDSVPKVLGDTDFSFEVFSEEPDWNSFITASDFEDGVITIEDYMIDDDQVNMNTVGTFNVIYTISNSNGATIIHTLSIDIVDIIPPDFEVSDVIIFTDDEHINWTEYIFNPTDNYSTTFTYRLVEDNVDYHNIGVYTVSVKVRDESNNETIKTFYVTVVEYQYANGFYNFKFANSDLRHTFVAAAEKYLMNTMYGGIPLFSSGSFSIYSYRLDLPIDEYIAVMGYGDAFGTMTADDSSVTMYDGLPGNVGEYTFRTAIYNNPGTFNQWLYDTSTDSTLMKQYIGSLYNYELNEELNGYSINPSMASGNPIPVDPEVIDFGKIVSNTWQIPLRDDLIWKYHPDTFILGLPNGHEIIDANDFVETYKLALGEGWFRAISGGGDFLAGTSAILNAEEYLNGEVSWNEVGIKVGDDDLTIEFTFVDQMSEFNILYWLSSFALSPINMDLYYNYESNLYDDQTNPYGTSNTTIAYSGAYYVDEYVPDEYIHMKENEVYHDHNLYFYTDYNYTIVADSTIIFQMFVDDKLDISGVPTAEVFNYYDDSRIRKVPGSTSYKLMINGLGTEEAQRELFPDGSWIPEPILANQEFKLAMFFAIDREYLAEDLLKVRTTSMYYASETYLVDIELGIPFRFTEQGLSVGEGLSPETYGFNFNRARELYLSAVEDLIASGDYEAGTADNPTEIIIELNSYTNSDSWDISVEYLKEVFEATFQDKENHINVIIEIYTKDFPAIYYDYMMIGEYDLSVGGISGSGWNIGTFLDDYHSDNRTEFTLNWGTDTSIAEIEVTYFNAEGTRVKEVWSFDAIASALNGEVYVEQGAEAVFPSLKDFEVTTTTVTYTVDKFDDPGYTNFSYTVQYWDVDLGYLDVQGMVDIPITSETFTITGLIPAFDDYPTTYLGDYEVTLNFDIVADLTKDRRSTAPWFMTESIIAEYTDVTTANQSVITLVLNDDVERTITDVEVLDYSGILGFEGITYGIEGLVISIAGLTSDTEFQVIFTFDDGYQDYIIIEYETIVD